ncbi:MAG: homogentisate 1,2-dioxygenase [Bacteroidetes bacterium]|nr:homogentisate 1,2-dioxygenase [Bacteroidota bacterium]
MPFYHKLGKIPHKRHTVFKSGDGNHYYEQLFGTEGFSGVSSLLYHVHRPTMINTIGKPVPATPVIADSNNITPLMLHALKAEPVADFLDSRKPLMVNQDAILGIAAPMDSMTGYFYKNSDADEILFIHRGKGLLKTLLGIIGFSEGDYLVIPRGMIYQIGFTGKENRIFYIESFHPVGFPGRYMNEQGQLLEHSPFCERDIKLPSDLETYDEKGEFLIKIKKSGMIHPLLYAAHPFDVVGWDGCNYPFGFSIFDFEPITGRVHQPPPVHQTFETKQFVVCSFCPRLYDYHPEAVPAPYNHSNIDSDEVIYYVAGEFMSRKDIGEGYISLHPKGIPHGPAPGAMEKSIGQKETKELAVMVDTFRPLMVTEEAMKISDGKYYKSWLE